jgi:hypothetical protein
MQAGMDRRVQRSRSDNRLISLCSNRRALDSRTHAQHRGQDRYLAGAL